MVETKVTDLTALTTTTADDVVMVVNDPAGVATSRQMTIPNLFGASGPVPSDLVLGVGQKIGIGNTPVRTLDVVGVQPQVRLRNVTTDATLKRGWVSVGHYTNAEEDVALLLLNADVSSNVLFWGGGTGSLNAATEQRFYAAATSTTVTGTQMARISTAGLRLENGVGGAPSDLFHVAAAGAANAFRVSDANGSCAMNAAPAANARLYVTGDSGDTNGVMHVELNIDAGNVPGLLLHNASTGTSAASFYQCQTAGGGDAYTRFRQVTSGVAWSLGLDNSQGDRFAISNNNLLGGADAFIIDDSSLKPSFLSTSDALLLPVVAGDPSTLVDGDIWYDSVADKYQGRENGVTVTFTTS